MRQIVNSFLATLFVAGLSFNAVADKISPQSGLSLGVQGSAAMQFTQFQYATLELGRETPTLEFYDASANNIVGMVGANTAYRLVRNNNIYTIEFMFNSNIGSGKTSNAFFSTDAGGGGNDSNTYVVTKLQQQYNASLKWGYYFSPSLDLFIGGGV